MLGAATVASCGTPRNDGSRHPFLLVTIDTLSADQVGCYGNPVARTPEMDRLARTGLQVRDAISPAPLTLPSHATILTGLDPPAHGVRDNGIYSLPEAAVSLPELLPDHVAKGSVVGAFPLSGRFGLTQGFDHYDDAFAPPADPRRPPERRADAVFGLAADWLARPQSGDRPFLWAHVFDPHAPYEAPTPWDDWGGARVRGSDREVAFVDAQLRDFLRTVAADSTVRAVTVLVVADHGESLGAHHELTHSIFVYDVTQRVPMILHGADDAAGLETRQRRLVDVAPTVLACYGLDPTATHAGDPLLSPPSVPEAYVETKYTELQRGWSPLHGIRTSRWKYIRAPRAELYDLQADPAELHNLHEDRTEEVEALSGLLDDVLAHTNDLAREEVDPAVLEQLRGLGYISTIEPGSEHDARLDPKDGIQAVLALNEGQKAYFSRDLPRAEQHFLRAIQVDDNSKEAHAFLAGTYFGLQRPDLSAEYAERALALFPHVNEGPIHATLGEAYLALDRAEDAVRHLETALTTQPGSDKLQRLLREARSRS